MDLLKEVGIEDTNSGAYCDEWLETSGVLLESRNPTTGEVIATIRQASADEYERCMTAAYEAFLR